MGHHLEAELGKDCLRLGFLFHHGGFQAVDATGGGRHGMTEFTIGPSPAGTLEDTFERAGWPLCLLDLRRLPASGPVAEVPVEQDFLGLTAGTGCTRLCFGAA